MNKVRLIFLGCLMCFCFPLLGWAQQDALTMHNITILNIGQLSMSDEYLSYLTYRGPNLTIKNEQWEYTSDKRNVSTIFSVGAEVGQLNNHVKSNEMFSYGAKTQYGAHYHYSVGERIMLIAGGFWDVDYMGRTLSESVNKEYSMSMATNLNLSAGAFCFFSWRRYDFRLSYRLSTPFVGYMLMPEMGSTYDEISFSTDDVLHVSSFHNKQALEQSLSLDIRSPHFTWRIGVEHEYMKYQANHIGVNTECIGLTLGLVTNLFSLRGNGYRIPDSFINIW